MSTQLVLALTKASRQHALRPFGRNLVGASSRNHVISFKSISTTRILGLAPKAGTTAKKASTTAGKTKAVTTKKVGTTKVAANKKPTVKKTVAASKAKVVKKAPLKAKKAPVKKDEPKASTLHFPKGAKTANAFFHQDLLASQKPTITNLPEASEFMKVVAIEWNNLSSTEKDKYSVLAAEDRARATKELQLYIASLTPEQKTRERRVQRYRRSIGKPISRASQAATRPTRTDAPLGMYAGFVKAMWADHPRAIEVCGQAWDSETGVLGRSKLLGSTWKGLSDAEKRSYGGSA